MSYLVYRLGKRGKQKRSNELDRGYYATGTTSGLRDPYKPMPYSRTLSRFHKIREKDENGNVRVRTVGYSPYENTIYIEDFVDKNSKLVKPKFIKGILRVDLEREPMLAELLNKLDYCEDKEGRDAKKPVKYHRVDKVKSAKDSLGKKEKVVKELAVFWQLPITKKQAIANAYGIRTKGVDLDVWQHELLLHAEQDPARFVEIYQNPDLEYLDYITRAENMNILSYNVNEWSYNEVKILSVSKASNKYDALVKHLINNPQLNLTIKNDVRGKEGYTELEVEQGVKVDFTKISGSDLLDMALEKRVVEYRPGKGFCIIATDKYFGETKSKDSAREALETDALLFQQVVAQLIK